MAETGQDVTGWAGDHIDIFINVLGWDGLPLDLTDATLTWGIGAVTTQPATVLKTTANPAEIEVLDMLGGRVVVHLQPADTLAMSGPMRHELQIDDAFGRTETLMVGHVQIHKASINPVGRREPLRVVAAE